MCYLGSKLGFPHIWKLTKRSSTFVLGIQFSSLPVKAKVNTDPKGANLKNQAKLAKKFFLQLPAVRTNVVTTYGESAVLGEEGVC